MQALSNRITSLTVQLERSKQEVAALKAQPPSQTSSAAAPAVVIQQEPTFPEVAELNLDQLVPADAIELLKSKYNRALGMIDSLKRAALVNIAEKKDLYEEAKNAKIALCNMKDGYGPLGAKVQDGEIRALKSKIGPLEDKIAEYTTLMMKMKEDEAVLSKFKTDHENAGDHATFRNEKGEEFFRHAADRIKAGASFSVQGVDSSAYIRKQVSLLKLETPDKTADQIKDYFLHFSFERSAERELALMETIRSMKMKEEKALRAAARAAESADAEPTETFYRDLYFQQMVLDPDTGTLYVNDLGEVVPLWKQYKEKIEVLMDEIRNLAETMPKEETKTLLRSVQYKARVFKLKSRYYKEYMRENFYVSDLPSAFCDNEAKHDDDSDDELRWVPRRRIQTQDPALIQGFSLRPSTGEF